MSELRAARKSNDSIMALAVLQQCTRNNVAGIMSYEMFSFTNSGEPKNIVKEFITEVEKTLKWVTNQAKNISAYSENDNLTKTDQENDSYREKLHAKTTEENQKVSNHFQSNLIQQKVMNFTKLTIYFLAIAGIKIYGFMGDFECFKKK